MSADVPFPALLERFERAMLAQAPHYGPALRPGATTEQLRGAEEALGVTLPQVLVDWFTWHDGTDVLPDGSELVVGPPDLMPYPLAQSVHWAMFMRDQAADRVEVLDLEDDQDPAVVAAQLYPPTLVPLLRITGSSQHVDVDEDGAMWMCDIWNAEQWLSRESSSLRATVAEWVRRLEDGTWTYEEGTGEWQAAPVEPEHRHRFSPVLYEREWPLATDIWPYR